MTPPEPEASIDADEEWIEKKMQQLANSKESAEDYERILLNDMTKGEQRAFCLGVRAGKHQAAQVVFNMSADHARATALVIDPYIK